MKWTVHKPKDCDLGKKQDQQGNKSQDIQWQVRASQATYAKMLAKLVQLTVDKWWCTWAWLAHGVLAMAEPTIVAFIKAIFLLTFLWGLHFLLSSAALFSQWLDLRAPSQRRIHRKRRCQCQLPRESMNNVQQRKRSRDKFAGRKRKKPVNTYLFLWSTFRVGCYIKKFLCQTYRKAQQAFLCCFIVTRDIMEKSTRIIRVNMKRIIANESTVEGDSPTYLARYDSEGVRHCRRVKDCRWGHICLPNWGRWWSDWHHQNPLQFLCARSEVASFVSQTLGRDCQGQPSNQVWNKNQGGWGWVPFVVVTTNKAKTSSPQPTYQYTHLPNCFRCHLIPSFWDDIHGMWCI